MASPLSHLLAALTLTFFGLLAASHPVAADRDSGTLRDMVYVSPSWGYSVRWYGDEWNVAGESSVDGIDQLTLTDAVGSSVRFAGRAGYHGDARACLDDLLAQLERDGARDIVVLRDDYDRPQKLFHPWRSWMLVIAGFPEGGTSLDQVVYLDCRTLAPEEAVFIRELRTPAATYSDELWHLDILNVALPRRAWSGNSFVGLSAPGLDPDWVIAPMPADSTWPWVYPDDPKLLTADGIELGMMTQVDGDPERGDLVVIIENSGMEPLTIDPARFSIANNPDSERPDPDLFATSAVWHDGAASGSRTLAPGEWASLLLDFPAPPEPSTTTFLVYWDDALSGGAVTLDCVDNCGYGGGGSRPRVRVGR